MNSTAQTSRRSELTFQGKPLRPGMAKGKAFILKNVDIEQLRKNKRAIDAVPSELARLDLAVRKSKEQISHSLENMRHDKRDQMSAILEAYLDLLESPTLLSAVKEAIAHDLVNAEYLLAQKIAELREVVSGYTDDLKKKSLITIQDLYYRIIYNMLPASEERISLIQGAGTGSVLVADRLTPVEVASIPTDRVVGIIVEETTANSHTSIMSQTLGVPVVIDLHGIGASLDEASEVMIDGYRGYIFVNPSKATIEECQRLEKRLRTVPKLVKARTVAKGTYTADGFDVKVMSNASNLSDIQLALRQGVADIGLFRSEMLYLASPELPSDDQECAFYREILSAKGINSLSLRLLDIGGEKLPRFLPMAKETNPQLGCRGIRFLLTHPDLMRKQICNILRSRQATNVRLLLPFISTMGDLDDAQTVISQVLAEMQLAGDSLEVGMMVEIPSVALSIEQFLQKVAFVNLGTNDLIQYFFAANRDQYDLKRYNRFSHPAFLKLLSSIVLACERRGKQLIACGAMASHPLGSSLLLALGVRCLSVQPDAISQIHQSVTKLKLGELRTALSTLDDLERADEVEQRLHSLGL
jgi:phosphotransferase system enzyme I (PtsI)